MSCAAAAAACLQQLAERQGGGGLQGGERGLRDGVQLQPGYVQRRRLLLERLQP